MSFWADKRVVVTGGAGFLGSYVVEKLYRRGCEEAFDAPDAQEDEIGVWGSGQATQEFFYVEDAAEAIVLAAERYNEADPVNIGAGFEISIRDLTQLIVEYVGFHGAVLWDAAKPDGQPRRGLDTSRVEREFGIKANTGIREGQRRTADWYRGQRQRGTV